MALTQMLEYQARWPHEYQALASRLRTALGPTALRIDHIGSTSVPGLVSKDVIDVQVTVGDLDSPDLSQGMDAAGFRSHEPAATAGDHVPPGASADPAAWAKRYYREPEGERAVHIHVRAAGRPNQRYALLFRDYLRAHDGAAEIYAEFKKRLAAVGIETGVYAEIKDPVCDLVMLNAERWASDVGWTPAPPHD